MAKARNYAKEYARDHSSPEAIKHRAMRNAARREMEKKMGDLPHTMEVDHKKALRNGGTNGKGNLRVVSRTTNRKKG